MRYRAWGALLSLILASCGGGGGDTGGSPLAGPIASAPAAGNGATACTLRARQDWAAQQLR
ncbi:MAG: hypothetical protein JWO81_242, partial [Alphaproteobacteria bacterium]|nr:hypothetical protein [Alphaproteobacteria bacterium]